MLLAILAQAAPGGGTAGGWLGDLQNFSSNVTATGKVAAGAAAVAFIIIGYIAKRTLGAVFAAIIVGGVVLYAVNHTTDLEKKTTDTFITGMGGVPAQTYPGTIAGLPPLAVQ